MSLFITFEGGEGSGKSGQVRAIHRRLARLDLPVILTHEPGGTSLGEKVARWLKWSYLGMSPFTELLLFNASRAQLVAEVIKPGLKAGNIVICDRYADSTIAYQSYGRGLDLETVVQINDTATQGLKPDLTILLDIPAEAGLARKSRRKPDRFEQEAIAFHRRVRDGYLKMAGNEPGRWLVIDATQPRVRVTQIIWEKISESLRG